MAGVLILLRRGFSGAVPGGLLEAIAIAIHGQDADVVGEAVEQRPGEAFRAQNRRPVLKRQVLSISATIPTTMLVQKPASCG